MEPETGSSVCSRAISTESYVGALVNTTLNDSFPSEVNDTLDDDLSLNGSEGGRDSLSDAYDIDDSILSDASDETDGDTDIQDSLANWSSTFNITHSSIRELLQILCKFHETLPKDPRALLGTKTHY